MFHIIIIKFSIFTNKNSQSDTFYPKLENTIVKIDIKSFSVQKDGKRLLNKVENISLIKVHSLYLKKCV